MGSRVAEKGRKGRREGGGNRVAEIMAGKMNCNSAMLKTLRACMLALDVSNKMLLHLQLLHV